MSNKHFKIGHFDTVTSHLHLYQKFSLQKSSLWKVSSRPMKKNWSDGHWKWVNDQYGTATGKARAFRNGITLDGRPKNKGVRAYFVKFGIFGKKY